MQQIFIKPHKSHVKSRPKLIKGGKTNILEKQQEARKSFIDLLITEETGDDLDLGEIGRSKKKKNLYT